MIFGPDPLSTKNSKEVFKSLLSNLTAGTFSVRVKFTVRYLNSTLLFSLGGDVYLYFPKPSLSSWEFVFLCLIITRLIIKHICLRQSSITWSIFLQYLHTTWDVLLEFCNFSLPEDDGIRVLLRLWLFDEKFVRAEFVLIKKQLCFGYH